MYHSTVSLVLHTVFFTLVFFFFLFSMRHISFSLAFRTTTEHPELQKIYHIVNAIYLSVLGLWHFLCSCCELTFHLVTLYLYIRFNVSCVCQEFRDSLECRSSVFQNPISYSTPTPSHFIINTTRHANHKLISYNITVLYIACDVLGVTDFYIQCKTNYK